MSEDPSVSAVSANEMGVGLAAERRYVEAIPHYLEARRLSPNWYAPWFNLGIAYKHAAQWRESLACSVRALELDQDVGQAVHWNIGIAATALGEWPRARAAWTACGIQIPEGDGPITMQLGPTPIRICPNDQPEVVWCTRVDPARAIIESVPTPESGRRFQDLLLHDGEPRGKRRVGEREVSVFNELAVLTESAYGTWCVEIEAPSEDDVSALYRALIDIDGAVEDWTGSFQLLCAACSEGNPDVSAHTHTGDEQAEWQSTRLIGIAAREEGALAPLPAWAREGDGRSFNPPERML